MIVDKTGTLKKKARGKTQEAKSKEHIVDQILSSFSASKEQCLAILREGCSTFYSSSVTSARTMFCYGHVSRF